jgi:single-stranded-DNA-specific exonuclease
MGGQITTEGIELENLEKDNRGEASDKIILKGSCRSLGDISVVDLMAHAGKTSAGGVFEGYGGHEGAGGFSLLFENVDKLSDALNESFKHIEKKEIQKNGVEVDMVISIDDVNDVTYDAMAVLAPFGEGNRKPIFEIHDAHALATKWFGKKGEHFEAVYGTSKGGRPPLRGDASRGTVKAIQFFAPKDIEEKVNKKHTVLVHLERSYFGGRVEMRMRIVGVK